MTPEQQLGIETQNKIALALLGRVLRRIDWETCEPHDSLLTQPHKCWFVDQIKQAARHMKAAGLGWEEWT